MSLYGKDSELTIKTGFKDDKTIITDLAFTAPFKILPPFYENGVMDITVLSVSAGLMDGDRQRINLNIGTDSRVFITSQAYEKIHKMKDGKAKRETYIKMDPKSTFVYQPLPTIPFAGSRFENKTFVNLTDSSCKFAYSEILTCGRLHYGERFKYDFFKNYTAIKREGKLIFRDNTVFDPKTMPLERFGFFEGYTHLGNLIICGLNEPKKWIELFRNIAEENQLESGVTQTDNDLIVVKTFHNNSESILNGFNEMIYAAGLI